MANELEKRKNTEVSTETAFDAFAGEGFGHQDATDFLIPRVAILGALSPQVKKNGADEIEGAEIGDIVDVAMDEFLAKQGKSFDIVFVARKKTAFLWKPRKAGGGIVDRQDLNETMDSFISKLGLSMNDDFECINSDGNEWIETHEYFALNLSGNGRPIFIPMKKSNLKVARKFFTKATAIKLPNGNPAPLFYKTYKVSTFLDSGGGNEWYNWKIEDGPLLQDYSDNWTSILDDINRLKEAITSGEKTGDMSGEENANPDDIPF